MFDDLYMINSYFCLPDKIKELKIARKELETIFYSQNMATRTEYTDTGIVTRAFRLEKMVIEHSMAQELLNKRIERNELRHKYFTSYLDSLAETDVKRLYQRHALNQNVFVTEQLEEQTIDEINEIETCICLREGIFVEEKLQKVELTDDFETNLDVLTQLFAI